MAGEFTGRRRNPRGVSGHACAPNLRGVSGHFPTPRPPPPISNTVISARELRLMRLPRTGTVRNSEDHRCLVDAERRQIHQ